VNDSADAFAFDTDRRRAEAELEQATEMLTRAAVTAVDLTPYRQAVEDAQRRVDELGA
jgi:hypothetical protein